MAVGTLARYMPLTELHIIINLHHTAVQATSDKPAFHVSPRQEGRFQTDSHHV